jgi:4-diphosphocytidyl-2-C-methyl-D-erythritol kinase
MKIIKKLSHSKINLGLEVLYKRPDNFHEINTIFATIKLSDQISFELSDKPIINIESNIDLNIPKHENLIFKAAEKLQDKFNIKSGANIILKKNIPTGGGLGGGSANAACTLIALSQLWEINPTYKQLFILAQALGSDVPFFLKEGFAIAHGRGEILRYFDYKLQFKILLIIPNIHINTALAYQSLNRGNEKKPKTNLYLILTRAFHNPSILKEHLFNDFEVAVFQQHPVLANIKDNLYQKGAIYASMSGSGSTMYGLFDNDEAINKAKEFFASENYKTIIV